MKLTKHTVPIRTTGLSCIMQSDCKNNSIPNGTKNATNMNKLTPKISITLPLLRLIDSVLSLCRVLITIAVDTTFTISNANIVREAVTTKHFSNAFSQQAIIFLFPAMALGIFKTIKRTHVTAQAIPEDLEVRSIRERRGNSTASSRSTPMKVMKTALVYVLTRNSMLEVVRATSPKGHIAVE